jgi:MFS family permease
MLSWQFSLIHRLPRPTLSALACTLLCSMIVLLHAYHLGFSAWQTAIMFTLYEVAGVVTNLLAGAMGARWGIKSTLLTGTP